ncbi:hypothetical protein JCM8208_007351 [Rhodotorula glutinis]
MAPQHGSTSEPLGREDEALLAAVDVSSLDKQEGYDVSLLALQPRDARPSPSSSPPADPRASFHSHPSTSFPDTLPAPSSAYPSGVPSSTTSRGDESAPLHPSSTERPSSDSRRFHRATAVPPLSAPNPRRAAQAYSERARAAEAHRLGDGASLEKGGSAGARGRGGRRRALWQRKGLVCALALVVLLVCGGIGAGLGVSFGGGGGRGGDEGGKGEGLEPVTAGESSGADVGVGTEMQQSVAPTMAPTAAPTGVEAEEDDEAARVPAPTHSAAEAAPVPTDAAASGMPSWEVEEKRGGGMEG